MITQHRNSQNALPRACHTMSMMSNNRFVLVDLLLLVLHIQHCRSFQGNWGRFKFGTASRPRNHSASSFLVVSSSLSTTTRTVLFSNKTDNNNSGDDPSSSSPSKSSSTSTTLSYDDTDAGSKGLVGGLTTIINALRGDSSSQSQPQSFLSSSQRRSSSPPLSSQELLERLRRDYTERNYLWTGELDLTCFDDNCRFTDPTISFVGTQEYTRNTRNLVPIVDAFVRLKDEDDGINQVDRNARSKRGESILLSIEDNPRDGYIETRWNMVGTLDKNPILFWKPTIDVIGRTKFWYRRQEEKTNDDDDDQSGSYAHSACYYQVWFYDEEWEVPAYKALLQLISPTRW